MTQIPTISEEIPEVAPAAAPAASEEAAAPADKPARPASSARAAKAAEKPSAATLRTTIPAPSAASQLTTTLPTLDMNTVSGPTGRPIITLSHVTKVYPAQPDKPALNDVSLQIYAGEFIFLVGHSGSGKSTFIRMLTREIKPTSGHIYIADEDLATMRNWRVPYLRRNVGCVF